METRKLRKDNALKEMAVKLAHGLNIDNLLLEFNKNFKFLGHDDYTINNIKMTKTYCITKQQLKTHS